MRSVKQNAFRYDAIVLTDLKGFKNAKDLRLEIFRGKSTRRQDRILGPLRGASIDRNLKVSGKKGLARYLLSYLYISRDHDYLQLLNVLRQPQNQGQALRQGQAVRGIGYDYLMEVTIAVSGFETENGPRRKVTNTYFLAYNEGEERDPEVILQ